MRDITKQTVEDLITFIYCGEVKVHQENVNDFLKTAKALKLNGLADECYEQTFDFGVSTSTWSAPAHNRLQYQSSQTNHVSNSANHDLAMAHSSYDQKPENAYQIQNNFAHEMGSDSENIDEMDNNGSDGNDQQFATKNDQWNGDSEMSHFYETQTTAATASKRKLLDRNLSLITSNSQRTTKYRRLRKCCGPKFVYSVNS